MAQSLEKIVVDLYAEGKSPAEIQEKTGARIEYIYAILKEKYGDRSKKH